MALRTGVSQEASVAAATPKPISLRKSRRGADVASLLAWASFTGINSAKADCMNSGEFSSSSIPFQYFIDVGDLGTWGLGDLAVFRTPLPVSGIKLNNVRWEVEDFGPVLAFQAKPLGPKAPLS